MMWIDAHTHFDFSTFDETRCNDWERAQKEGVRAQFVMSVSPQRFANVVSVSQQYNNTYFALGVHPLFIDGLDMELSMNELRSTVELHRDNPSFIGIGEIGLDFYHSGVDINAQVDFFRAQLKIAKEYDLPVFIHARKSHDSILKYCRQYGVTKGIMHAFNGSHQQAERAIDMGFKLGFGGAFTYERAKHLRRLVVELPLEALVFETDAPDMSPAWAYRDVNYSYYLPKIAQECAFLREIELSELSRILWKNTEMVVGRSIAK